MQEGKNIKLATGTSLMADDRAIVDEAYAGDIIGLFDPGIFSIGDTLCTGKQHVQFAGIPTFAPEHFARVTQVDTMKRKQFVKGMEQIAQEGAIQISATLAPVWRKLSSAWSACCSWKCWNTACERI